MVVAVLSSALSTLAAIAEAQSIALPGLRAFPESLTSTVDVTTYTAGGFLRVEVKGGRAGLVTKLHGKTEIFCPPKAWAEALWPNLFYWNEVDKGGHFAAFEQPKLFTRSCGRPSGHGEVRNP